MTQQTKTKNKMTVGSKEFYEMMSDFESVVKTVISARLDKEEKDQWSKGRVYQHGEVNQLWKGFQLGYSNHRIKSILENQ